MRWEESVWGAEYFRFDQGYLTIRLRRGRRIAPLVSWGDARTVRRRRYVFVIYTLIFVGLQVSRFRLQSSDPLLEATSTSAREPSRLFPSPSTDPLKIRLGERLFGDKRLSR
jgi:cytochrome c peroxidase